MSWAALNNVFEVVLSEFGDFHIVCPGAGIYEPYWSNFWHPPGSPESRDDLDANSYSLLNINLVHPIRATQLAISYWLHPRKQLRSAHPMVDPVTPENPRRIVHIPSVAGQIPNFNAPMYGASKFAITGFVRCLAPLDEAIGVRVNAVAPGIVRTPLWTEHPEKLMLLDQETDGLATAEEVAMALLRCLEDEDLKGGSVMEVGKDTTRRVEVLNDPGPDERLGAGFKASKTEEGTLQILNWLRHRDVWGERQDAVL
jgi:NAD(P)-dependent dehydrogenase (short-subunit alcohol dehydrogenase family)